MCVAPWKTCGCLVWDEARLLARAEAYVHNGQAPAVDGQNYAQQVAAMGEHLRANHECTHERFKGLREKARDYHCEMCGTDYKGWIYQCRQCLMITCNRCRHNRT